MQPGWYSCSLLPHADTSQLCPISAAGLCHGLNKAGEHTLLLEFYFFAWTQCFTKLSPLNINLVQTRTLKPGLTLDLATGSDRRQVFSFQDMKLKLVVSSVFGFFRFSSWSSTDLSQGSEVRRPIGLRHLPH